MRITSTRKTAASKSAARKTTRRRHRAPAQPVAVVIRCGSRLSVSPDPVTIGVGGEIVWVPDPLDCDFAVTLDKSPFTGRRFSYGKFRSGKAKGPKGHYKYTVTCGKAKLDPIIIVN